MKKAFIFFFTLIFCLSASPQQKTLSGRVLGEDGQPVNGATISVKEYNKITVSDSAGIFKLGLPYKEVMIVVTHVGYEPQSFTVAANKKDVEVYLKNDESVLQKVIVSTGYQDIPKERATGSFTTVNNALLNRNVAQIY
jgi:hypothetical protein